MNSTASPTVWTKRWIWLALHGAMVTTGEEDPEERETDPAHQNAGIPVAAWPRIREWMSWVPS